MLGSSVLCYGALCYAVLCSSVVWYDVVALVGFVAGCVVLVCVV